MIIIEGLKAAFCLVVFLLCIAQVLLVLWLCWWGCEYPRQALKEMRKNNGRH